MSNPAHRLEATADVSDHPSRRRNSAVPDPPINFFIPAKQIGLDPIKDDVDLPPVRRREELLLKMRRAIAALAGLEVEQEHRVPRPCSQEVQLRRRKLGPEVHVRPMRMIIKLEVIDDRHARIKFGQVDRRAETAMTHDQVRAQVFASFARLKNTVRMPDRILKGPAAIVRRLTRTTGRRVFNLFDPVDSSAGSLRDEAARPPSRPDQMSGDVPELGGEVLVDEQDVHESSQKSRRSAPRPRPRNQCRLEARSASSGGGNAHTRSTTRRFALDALVDYSKSHERSFIDRLDASRCIRRSLRGPGRGSA